MPKKIYSYQSQQFLGVVVVNPETKLRAVKLNAQPLYQHFLNETCKLGDEVTMNITNKRPKRTTQQNSYLHLYLSLISESSGHTMKELKAWIKGKFLTQGISEVFGEKTRVVKDTRELNVSEFIELLERIEETTHIPLPDTAPFLKPLSHEEYAKLKEKQKSIYARLVFNPKIKLSTAS